MPRQVIITFIYKLIVINQFIFKYNNYNINIDGDLIEAIGKMGGMFAKGFESLSEKITSSSVVNTVGGTSSIILPDHCNKVDIHKTILSGNKRQSTSPPPSSPDDDRRRKDDKKKSDDKKKKKKKKQESSPSSKSSSDDSSSCESSPSRHKKKKKKKEHGDRIYNVKMNFGDKN